MDETLDEFKRRNMFYFSYRVNYLVRELQVLRLSRQLLVFQLFHELPGNGDDTREWPPGRVRAAACRRSIEG